MKVSDSARKLLNTAFVGRKYAFEAIEKLWTVPQGAPRSMLFWGDWNVGKSEVLWNVRKHCQGINVAYTSTQRLGRDRDTVHVWTSLAFALEKIVGTVYLNEIPYLENPYPTFVESLEEALDKYPDHKLLLAIDEYEGFLTIPEAPIILKQLEELTLKHDRLAFLLCGSHDSHRVEIGFKPTRKLWLGAFTKEETAQFVSQQPYKFDTDAIDRLHELTSGQPWLVRGLCFNIISHFNEIAEENHEAPSSVSIFDVDEIANSDRFYENYRLYFAGLWSKQISCQDTTLQQVLTVLADEPQGFNVREIAWAACDIGTRYSLQVAEVCKLAMEYHAGSLIEKHWENDVEVYKVAIELFRRWIIRTQK